ncbi:MAG: AAA family ATPase [Oscillospiraceae bacterium]|nr:AAA family ATPase [Oscillospiraceae bacterium]
MASLIKKIDILGLYSGRDYSVEFDSNNLILVGENGSGKTTISRIIYAVLSCNWDLLRTYPFDKIVLYFNEDIIEVDSKTINAIYSMQNADRIGFYFERRYSRKSLVTNIISSILELKSTKEASNEMRFRSIHGIPYEYIAEILDSPEVNALFDLNQAINQHFDSQILYLPTYRRIEEQLQNIFPDIDLETLEKRKKPIKTNKVIELVEFGMDDVQQLVKKESERLRSFSQERQSMLTLGYLGEIVSKTYDHSSGYQKIRDLEDWEIQEVLSRIDSSILSDSKKEELLNIINFFRNSNQRSYTAQVKIICHYFTQLWEFNNEIKKSEKNIRDFVEKVNKYLVNNKVIYDSEKYTCEVFNIVRSDFSDDEKLEKIKFQDLSSGEKQIVSLFGHLYLDENDSAFVFIDEPELSLSVDWQKTLLPDISTSPKFCGLLATTHSPFVFDNDLESVVHGINEFLIKG